MSTEFINDQWRLPNAWNGSESNVNKQSNYSMSFDSASSDYIVTSSNVGISGSQSRTMSVWIKGGSANNNKQWPMAVAFGAASTANAMWIGGGSNTGVYWTFGWWGVSEDIYTSIRIDADEDWHMLTSTYDESTQIAKGYLDGVEVASVTRTGINTTDSSLIIGKHLTDSTYWDGQIDAVSIFDYALSSSQITTLYGSSSTGIGNPMSLSPKPVAYYPLGDQDAFNGANYLVPNSSLKDYVFDIQSNNSIDFQNGLLSNLSAFTFSFWYKRGAANATSATLIEQNGVISISQYRNTASYSGIEIILTTVDGQSSILTTNQGNVPVGEWLHVGIVYDGNNITLYRNGSQSPGTYNPIAATGNTVNNSNIFEIVSQSSLQYEISNLAIFNTALPATGSNSVETLYNNGSPLTSMSGFSSLTNWWKLDASDTYDGTNWTIEDHAGTNDGTSSGMTQANLVQSDLSFKTSISPFALDFDGTNDYISLPTITLTDNWSVSVWMNQTALKLRSQAVGTTLTTPTNNFWNYGAQVPNGGAYAGKLIYYNYSTSQYTPLSNNRLDDGNWHNWIISYDHSTTTLKCYIDGQENYSDTYNTGTGNTINRISNTFASNYWLGQLSNISIWNTDLTSAQVSEIYNEGVPSNLNNHSAYSNLVSWWQLGSNSSFNTNWTVLDEVTASGNNGTSVNMGEDAIVDGVGSYANGLSSGMGGDEVIGSAPFSDANSLSINMDVLDRVEDTPS